MRIIEAGHYYSAKGPTKFSLIGWNIMKRFCVNGDKRMLFIDDFHDWDSVPKEEKILSKIEFSPKTDFSIFESEVENKAQEVLKVLRSLSKRKKAKKNKDGKWYCSGFSVTNNLGVPNCVLLDAGLTLYKKELGFKEGINILPIHYKDEQKKLFRLVKKVLPDFHLKVVLFDLEGNIRNEIN